MGGTSTGMLSDSRTPFRTPGEPSMPSQPTGPGMPPVAPKPPLPGPPGFNPTYPRKPDEPVMPNRGPIRAADGMSGLSNLFQSNTGPIRSTGIPQPQIGLPQPKPMPSMPMQPPMQPPLSVPPPFTPAPPPPAKPVYTGPEQNMIYRPPHPDTRGPIYDPHMANSEPWNQAYTSRQPAPRQPIQSNMGPGSMQQQPPTPSMAQLLAAEINKRALAGR